MARKAGSPQLVQLANEDGVPYDSGNPIPTDADATSTATLVDRSGTITTGGTAQEAAAANASREYLLVRNPATESEDLWVSLVGPAAAASPSIPLAPGDQASWSGKRIPSNALSVLAATTGHVFTVWEG